jgi:alginate O-acetyltransferase complex protein AlgI
MNFNSVNYLIFLPVVTGVYFLLPKKYKNLWLIVTSYFFYFCAESRFFFLLPVLTVSTYFGGIFIEKRANEKKKTIFISILVFYFLILGFFKYNGFFAAKLSKVRGAGFSPILLPVGLSFYMFMAVSYLADVYLKKYTPTKNFVNFALYMAFFSHILMGPIDRWDKFSPQIEKEHKFDYENVRSGLLLMALGFFKKIAVADILAMFINEIHNDLYTYKGPVLILTAFLYSFQLYADFSGYSDIAVASGKILGFDIGPNFNTPYLSTNFSTFWSRWHISLSSWFQDYVFTPFVWTNPLKKIFGEDSKPPVKTAVALVFVLSGIWHGNTMNFFIWGCFHALYRVGEEIIHKKFGKPKKKQKKLLFWPKVAVTFTLTTFSQIFFRRRDIPAALYYIKNMALPAPFAQSVVRGVKNGFDATPLLINFYIIYCGVVLAILIALDILQYFKLKGKSLTLRLDALPKFWRWVCYYALIAFIMAAFIMNNGGYGVSASFIYNNF